MTIDAKNFVLNVMYENGKAALYVYYDIPNPDDGNDLPQRDLIKEYDVGKMSQDKIWKDFEEYAALKKWKNVPTELKLTLSNWIQSVREQYYESKQNQQNQQQLADNIPINPIWKEETNPIQCTFQEAYDEIYNYAQNHIYMPRDVYYHILTCWIMATYFQKDWEAVPYLAFIAPKKSGKTRGLDIIAETAYRGFKTSSTTPSPLFRAIQAWHITFCLDEAEYALSPKSKNSGELLPLFNDGYKKGGKVIRNEIVGDNYVPTAFDVYGFKALASTRTFIPTLFSRCIVVHMQKKKPKNKHLNYKESKKIRSMMIYLETQPLTPYNKDLSEDGRLEELFIPIYTITENTYPDRKALLDEHIKELEAEDAEADSETFEYKIIYYINKLIEFPLDPNDKDKIYFMSIAKNILMEEGGAWTPKTGKDMSQRLGYTLPVIGLVKEKKANRAYISVEKNKKVLQQLYARYLPSITPPWRRPIQQQTSQDTSTVTPQASSPVYNNLDIKADTRDDLICD